MRLMICLSLTQSRNILEYGRDVSQDDSDKEVLEIMIGVMHIDREGGGRVLSRGRGRPKYNSGSKWKLSAKF